MAYIISIVIAYLGYQVTGYDFFILLTLISIAIEIYIFSLKILRILKRFLNNTKDNTAKR